MKATTDRWCFAKFDIPESSTEAEFLVLVSKALDPPMEFVGDAYKLKQVAKHSAALQALNYLEAGTLPCRHFL